jgi:hypothetical protein
MEFLEAEGDTETSAQRGLCRVCGVGVRRVAGFVQRCKGAWGLGVMSFPIC